MKSSSHSSSQTEKILVTSALPYANGAVHLGHLAGAYLPADIFVRYHRLKGSDIVFICGSDEHGVSIPISARKENVTPREIIDRYHEMNRLAFERCGISFDNYSRTSRPIHHETAQGFFIRLLEKNILKSKVEKQLFDEKAQMFLPDRYVTGTCPSCGYDTAYGDQCEKCGTYYNQIDLLNPRSLITGEKPVVKDTLHWYFPLGDFQTALEKYIADRRTNWKDNVYQQVQSWLKQGLGDRPITRDLDWGVDVPLEEAGKKVLYVWFEALLGYISSSKEWAVQQQDPTKWEDYWLDPSTRYIAFIGKDNIVFHCLMFPAMLMAYGDYTLPENVPANEFLNLEGQKFSKSRDWSIELHQFLDLFPADTLRYTLALNLPETKDSDFYWKDFQARTNNELADILGNFVNRTLLFVQKNFSNSVPEKKHADARDGEFEQFLQQSAELIASKYEAYRFRDGATATMNLARAANKYFNDSEPWRTIKSDPERCGSTMYYALQAVFAMSVLFEPLLPQTTARIRTLLNIAHDQNYSWNDSFNVKLEPGHQLGNPEILFQKIEDSVIDIQVQKLTDRTQAQTAQMKKSEAAPLKEQITIDQFAKLDFRIAKVLAAERVKKSEKLIKLQIDTGIDTRQIVAGIGKHYEPSALVGKQIVVVANLAPTKLMGVESQGMVLAASNANDQLTLIMPMDDISPGSVVK